MTADGNTGENLKRKPLKKDSNSEPKKTSSDPETKKTSSDPGPKMTNSDPEDEKTPKTDVKSPKSDSEVNKNLVKDGFVAENECLPILEEKRGRSLNFLAIIIVIVCVCVFPIMSQLNGMQTTNEVKNKTNLDENKIIKNDRFMEEMDSIIKMLENTRSNLKYVNRSLTIFMKEEPVEKPAIVLLLATNRSECALCVSLQRFLKALSEYYSDNQPLVSSNIAAHELTQKDENEGKLFIENSIEDTLKSDKHMPVVVMDGIDRFPISSLSKVHAYVDHENAPHQNIIFILTSVVADEVELEIERSKQLVKIATEHFDNQWSEYDFDHRRALMGRITSVIGLIHEGQLKNELKKENIDNKILEQCHNKCGNI